jgi:N-acetyl-gamma-glutamyl-phosphate reductase
MRYRVFVDGQAGTTGLEINERLARRPDIELLVMPEAERRSTEARREYLNRAEVAFLCLPDEAARESVSLVSNPELRLIDASTAHRVDPGWSYGLPELSPVHRAAIARSRRTTVPGCHATGFVLLTYPLVKAGLLPPDWPVVCFSVSGYSGAGKKLIEQYRAPDAASRGLESPRHYALDLRHKHLPEMTRHAGLDYPPLFSPVVANYYRGMAVSVPLTTRSLPRKASIAAIHEVLSRHYAGERFVKVIPLGDAGYLDNGYLGATRCNGTNQVELSVHGNPEQTLLVAVLDNLGKGASGAAVQCMNLMLSLPEGAGLEG